MVMYPRSLELPNRSFFLFGPRGTGKTTWLHTVLDGALWFDLVREAELLRLVRDPTVFRAEVSALPPGSWIVVDEIQRYPALLGEVHELLSSAPGTYRFALTGSSARKLKRDGANLLPGRVINRRFFPLTAQERSFDFVVDELLRFGGLPAVCSTSDEREKTELLEAYVENYITQEIRLEAVVKRLDSFVRFLEVAALMNAQVVNVAAIARDAAVARPTVLGYFEALVDTLVGVWLPAWRPQARVKEVAHAKFYFFDPGVCRAIAGRLRDPLESTERGSLLETYVLHELRAWMNLAGTGGELCYWRTPHGNEVDFIWQRAARAVGIEVKAAPRWRPADSQGLAALLAAGAIGRAYGVYLGEHPLQTEGIQVLPLRTFLERLVEGEIIPV